MISVCHLFLHLLSLWISWSYQYNVDCKKAEENFAPEIHDLHDVRHRARIWKRQTGGCSEARVNTAEREGTITSPGYPRGYPDDLDCRTTITARPGTTITLLLDVVDLEVSEDCVFDHVEVYDGSSIDAPSMGRYCSDTRTSTLQSSGNSLLVRFRSDEFSGGKGFSGRYVRNSRPGESLPPSLTPTRPPDTPQRKNQASKGCESMLDEAENVIRSPGYPRNYDENLECEIIIHANNPGDHVILTIEAVDLEQEEECLFDYMEVFDGSTTASPSLGRFCGEIPADKRILVSTGDSLLVHFKSDDFGSGTGFLARYSSPKGNNVDIPTVPGHPQPRPRQPSNCGIAIVAQPTSLKAVVIRGRIVGGSEAAVGAHPWQVLLWDLFQKAFCAGVLLTDRWVVTAAHCFNNTRIQVKNVVVRLGKHDSSADEDREMTMDIERVVLHPSYNNNTLFNSDIAMVKFVTSITFTNYILPICLGDARDVLKNVFESNSAWGLVVGWGRTHELGLLSKKLKELNVPIVSQKKCSQAMPPNTITENMFCAGFFDGTGDACDADSGGPLMVQMNSRWTLVGLVSWGIGCARLERYGVYTRVINFYDWMNTLISS